MAKRSNTKFETTITCSKETRDTLLKIKAANDNLKTYDEVIQQLLFANEGLLNNDFEIISTPKIAITLHANDLDENGVQVNTYEKPIYYNDLKEAYVGKVYEMNPSVTSYFTGQSAEIVYKSQSKDFVLLRIKTIIKQEQLEEYSELVGVEIL